MKRRIIFTNNREIYEKFNMLNFSTEVLLQTAKPIQVERIIGNINKNDKVLQFEKIGDYFVVRKIGTVNFNVYLRV